MRLLGEYGDYKFCLHDEGSLTYHSKIDEEIKGFLAINPDVVWSIMMWVDVMYQEGYNTGYDAAQRSHVCDATDAAVTGYDRGYTRANKDNILILEAMLQGDEGDEMSSDAVDWIKEAIVRMK